MPKRDPKTKEQLLDRMLSYDFDGDIRHLGAQTARIERIGSNALRLTFPDTDTVFDLTVHRPREFAKPNERKAEGRSFGGAAEAEERRADREAKIVAEAPAPAVPPKKRVYRKRANAAGAQGKEA